MLANRPILLLAGVLASCVTYQSDPADATVVAAELAKRTGGAFTITAALDVAFRQKPDLVALTARVRAAEARTVPFDVLVEGRGRSEAVGAMVDPIALLGLGPRGAALQRVSAEHEAAVADLAVARWGTATAVLEAFLVDQALAGWSIVEIAGDAAAFEQAGLASPAAAAALRAAQAGMQKERVDLQRERTDNLARVRRQLGLPRDAAVQLEAIPEEFFRMPEGSAAELLQRPDLRLATARFEIADAAFRQAVADQYPSIQLGPNVSLRGDPLRAVGMLRVPIGMAGRAAAARELRSAARHEIESAFLAAQEQAALADARLMTADAALVASRTALRATTTEWRAARTRLETEPDAFVEYSRAARAVVRDTHAHRVAVLEHVRARVERARAYGWPHTEITP